MLIAHDDLFEVRPPSNQTLVDLFEGQWKTAFPPELGIESDGMPYFEDTRVAWAGARIGGLEGKQVLELGPFEAYNTVHICREGPAEVVAVEANRINFLKCLVVKELFGIDARFKLGDFISYLEETEDRYDICYASGVLYHQTEPLRFLRAVATVAPAVFVWTHHYDEDALRGTDAWNHFDGLEAVRQELDGFEATMHPRSYKFRDDASRPRKFSGGFESHAYWMELDDIFSCLDRLGFGDIDIRHHSATAAGPTVSFLAKR